MAMKMNLMRLKVVALVFLLSTTLSMAAEPEFWKIHLTPRTHVLINNLFADLSNLNMHCWSGNDDLGERVLPPGQTNEIVFYPNIFFTTKFVCRFWWAHGSQQIYIYRAVRDMKRCYKNCSWLVSEDGITGYNYLGIPDITYKWNNP